MDEDYENMGDGGEEIGEEEDEETSMLKSALHYSIFQMAEEVKEQFHMSFSRPLIAALADNVFRMMKRFGRDLELFSKHAARNRVKPEDVKLLFRNNPEMSVHMDDILQRLINAELAERLAKIARNSSDEVMVAKKPRKKKDKSDKSPELKKKGRLDESPEEQPPQLQPDPVDDAVQMNGTEEDGDDFQDDFI